ncbi:MAG: stage II sporulation protein D [Bacillaceae bacterium]|nr:stage II sporulation protein D [Bacillaceae bacterium]
MLKRLVATGVLLIIAIVVIIPAALVFFFGNHAETAVNQDKESEPAAVTDPAQIENQITVNVYRSQENKVEKIPLEAYVEGVVAAEMPAEFEIEALKAQAMAARTYIIRRIAEKDFSDTPQGAHVTDTVKHQVYMDDHQRRNKWGPDYDWKMAKIREAVLETRGQVITYQGKPINATFFSTSNGYTENSEEYWSQQIPYLRSVKVPWDQNSPLYEKTTVIPVKQFTDKLGVNLSVPVASGSSWSQVLDRTTGNRIARIKVGDRVFSGREIREKLELPSSHFDLRIENDMVLVTTRGYGHGVGMSQWGAHGMARDGKTVDEIIKYFYQGVEIEDYHQWVREVNTENSQLQAKK